MKSTQLVTNPDGNTLATDLKLLSESTNRRMHFTVHFSLASSTFRCFVKQSERGIPSREVKVTYVIENSFDDKSSLSTMVFEYKYIDSAIGQIILADTVGQLRAISARVWLTHQEFVLAARVLHVHQCLFNWKGSIARKMYNLRRVVANKIGSNSPYMFTANDVVPLALLVATASRSCKGT